VLGALARAGAARRGDDRGDHLARRVLPIGGLKDKVLAAHRADIFTVVIPKENRKDLKDIPRRS